MLSLLFLDEFEPYEHESSNMKGEYAQLADKDLNRGETLLDLVDRLPAIHNSHQGCLLTITIIRHGSIQILKTKDNVRDQSPES